MKKSNGEYLNRKMKGFIKSIVIKMPNLFKGLSFIHSIFTDFDGREHWLQCKKSEKIYYVIRPRTNCIEGLLSLYIYVMKKVDYALRKGFIPVVDMKNYKTQYFNGEDNIWEWFFKPIAYVSLNDVYNSSESVLLSGYKWKNELNNNLFSQEVFINSELCDKCYKLMFNTMEFNPRILNIVREEFERIPIAECIGVYLRGTDYVKLKPVGENVQPTAEMVIEKIYEFKNMYGNPPIYLVTEDNEIYSKIREAFADDLYIVSFDSFISNYDGKDFLSKSDVFNKDMRTVGEEYLAKMILLSKCKYLVSSITCGSRAAYVFNGNKFTDQYIFDLGKYK